MSVSGSALDMQIGTLSIFLKHMYLNKFADEHPNAVDFYILVKLHMNDFIGVRALQSLC